MRDARDPDEPVAKALWFDERFDGNTGMGGFEIWIPVKT
jgi:hypothetical protein